MSLQRVAKCVIPVAFFAARFFACRRCRKSSEQPARYFYLKKKGENYGTF